MAEYDFSNREDTIAFTLKCRPTDVEYITHHLTRGGFQRKYTPPNVQVVPSFSEAMEESVAEDRKEQAALAKQRQEATAELGNELRSAGVKTAEDLAGALA